MIDLCGTSFTSRNKASILSTCPTVSFISNSILVSNNNNNNNNSNYNNNKFFENILLTTMLTIKILFTINSLEKRKNYSFKTLFTIPVDLKST